MRKLALLVFLVGCGGGGGGAASDGGLDAQGASGTIALGGALTDSAPCLPSAIYTPATDTSTLGFDASSVPAGYLSITASFQTKGAVAIKTYTAAELTGGVTIRMSDGRIFTATIGTTSVGAVNRFAITSSTLLGSDGTTTRYEIHGSFQATLPLLDVNGNPGGSNVTMSATF